MTSKRAFSGTVPLWGVRLGGDHCTYTPQQKLGNKTHVDLSKVFANYSQICKGTTTKLGTHDKDTTNFNSTAQTMHVLHADSAEKARRLKENREN